MNTKGIEKAALFIFLLHHLFMFIGAVHYDFPSWISAVILLTGGSSLVIIVGNSWQYITRAIFISIMANVSLILYGSQTDSIYSFLLPFLGITVVIALFGIPKLLIVPTISVTFLFLFHRYSIGSFAIKNIDEFYLYYVPIFNVYFIIFILYFWNNKRKESSHQMDKVISELKNAEQGKDDFIANVSHEIRTPVNNIVGLSEILLRENLSDDVKDSVSSIQSSGKQLVSLVSDILDFSELASGKIQLVETEYNLEILIRDIIDYGEVKKGNKKIDVLYDCDGTIPLKLIGDQQKITRIITNLLDNAIKFTNEGSVVLKITYRPESYGVNLIITISDTGIGMDEKEIEKLYTSYNQVDTKRNRQEGGIGLGMAITQSIVEIMGGVISVFSQREVGTEVRVVIPQKVASEEPLVKAFATDTVNMYTYYDENQFDLYKTRDSYRRIVLNIANDLNISIYQCHNLAELKRRSGRDASSIVLVGYYEYVNFKEVIDELANDNRVVVLVDKDEIKNINNDNIYKLCKPIYIGSFMEMLNPENVYKNRSFIAPDARVLIVDDNKTNLKVISGLMNPYQMQITLSTSGADALEKVDKSQYDLIFMDHMMPEMDGVETLKRIRNKSGLYFKEVPVVALTANAVAGAREMFINEGFQDFISKPVEVALLDKVLKYYLSNKIIFVDDKIREDVSHRTDEISLGDINTKQGIEFCGSWENLLDVLRIHSNDGDENYSKIDSYFKQKDWKNYAILVHGLKSSMKSVGANPLSEKAKALEFAAKDLDLNFIMENHDEMMKEYKRILKILNDYFGKENKESVEVDFSKLSELSELEFESVITEFENASYSWDALRIKEVLVKLENRYYKDESVLQLYETVCNKVEMTDYISAVELIRKWKDKVDRKA